jgi:hypothetical protein
VDEVPDAVPSPICAPSSTMALGMNRGAAISQQQQAGRRACRRARQVQAAISEFQRLEALAAVGLGLCLAAQVLDDVVVVQRVAEAIDRGGGVAGLAMSASFGPAFRRIPSAGSR